MDSIVMSIILLVLVLLIIGIVLFYACKDIRKLKLDRAYKTRKVDNVIFLKRVGD